MREPNYNILYYSLTVWGTLISGHGRPWEFFFQSWWNRPTTSPSCWTITSSWDQIGPRSERSASRNRMLRIKSGFYELAFTSEHNQVSNALDEAVGDCSHVGKTLSFYNSPCLYPTYQVHQFFLHFRKRLHWCVARGRLISLCNTQLCEFLGLCTNATRCTARRNVQHTTTSIL